MSSDSGESHVSAQNDNEGDIESGAITLDSPVGSQGTELGDVGRDVPEEEEKQELESIGSGANGMSFARRRRSQNDEGEEESVSELAIRPVARRPGSPESTSTPDDSPSIQVGDGIRDKRLI